MPQILGNYECIDLCWDGRSGKKKEQELKQKLLGPDNFLWGWGLPHEGVGAK